MIDWEHARAHMVEAHIARRGVRDARVQDAFRKVPREVFVPEALQEFAYEDTPLPIPEGQTISQPYIVALMAQAAGIGPKDKVLEIGTGSGYAAAILATLGGRVFTIERHAGLADAARERLRRLGFGNVEVRTGDGTLGWPEAAPFDAILAAAGGPSAPDSLKDQLAIGGRLVIPVGERGEQTLLKLTRTGPDSFSEEDLGGVRFVPLIGAEGWSAEGPPAQAAELEPVPEPVAEPPPPTRGWPMPQEPLPALIARAAEPLPEIDDPAFAVMFDRFASARVVLLGEASHGTSEFYRARAAITRRLIEAYGFTIVAVEADWPDAAAVDRHVRHRPALPGAEPPFQRFPTWMWRNAEVEAFAEWLRARNAGLAAERQAGFYGLDLYNLNASIAAVIGYLERVDPEAAAVARERYGCLTPWRNAPQNYGRMALNRGYNLCEGAVVAMLRELLDRRMEYAGRDGESFLDATQNARLVRDAEAYYRAMYYGAAESWNLRDRHMFDSLCQLLESKGPEARAVVWAHNSHIGDARFTEMGVVREELNIGQLCRERFGGACALIGFGTHAGTVACATDWDQPMEVKRINPSRPDSYERLSHDAGPPRFLLDLRPEVDEAVRYPLLEPRLERFIGVIYRPDTERWSHYAEASLPQQFDAWVWFDETTAVTPLPRRPLAGEDDTYPFAL